MTILSIPTITNMKKYLDFQSSKVLISLKNLDNLESHRIDFSKRCSHHWHIQTHLWCTEKRKEKRKLDCLTINFCQFYICLQPMTSQLSNYWCFFKKNGQNPASFSLLFGLFKQTSLQFLKQINVKKCHRHPVNGAVIRTHDLWNMSLLPYPLDQDTTYVFWSAAEGQSP